MPKNVAIVIETWPQKLCAEISPKPMVITVMKTYQVESRIEVKPLLKISYSLIRTEKRATTTKDKKNPKISGCLLLRYLTICKNSKLTPMILCILAILTLSSNRYLIRNITKMQNLVDIKISKRPWFTTP